MAKATEVSAADPVMEISEIIHAQTRVGPVVVLVSERRHTTASKKIVICEVCITTIEDGKRTTVCTPIPCPNDKKPKGGDTIAT